jgi:hypothetical protein
MLIREEMKQQQSAALEPNSITNLSRKYDFQWITQFGNKTRPQECEDAYMLSTYTFGASGELISFGRVVCMCVCGAMNTKKTQRRIMK